MRGIEDKDGLDEIWLLLTLYAYNHYQTRHSYWWIKSSTYLIDPIIFTISLLAVAILPSYSSIKSLKTFLASSFLNST